MRYIKYSIRTIPAAEDVIVAAMEDIGLFGAEIQDNVPLTAAEKEQIYTYDVDDPVDDNRAIVSFYAAEHTDTDPEAVRKEILRVLSKLKQHTAVGSGEVTVEVTDDADWLNNWKQYFHRFFIGDDILVIPSWEEASAEEMRRARIVLHIDPGTAFGTGAHETTKLCALLLCDHMSAGARVLDIGTGSGILAILAQKEGAAKVLAVDVDPFTKEAVKDNCAGNGIDMSRFHYHLGDLIKDGAFRETIGSGYDLVTANILPVVLEPLMPFVPGFLKEGGIYIMSGILTEKLSHMIALAKEANFSVIEQRTLGAWSALALRKK